MLTIRQAQIDALAASRVEDFERRLLAHLRDYFPRQMAALDGEQALTLVRHAIAEAADRGVTAERDVCKLANLLAGLGPDLLDKHEWAAAAWSAPALTPADRVNRLYDATLAEVKRRKA